MSVESSNASILMKASLNLMKFSWYIYKLAISAFLKLWKGTRCIKQRNFKWEKTAKKGFRGNCKQKNFRDTQLASGWLWHLGRSCCCERLLYFIKCFGQWSAVFTGKDSFPWFKRNYWMFALESKTRTFSMELI